MSGIVSGVTKVFSAVGSGIAKVGKAVLGVGATLFTGGAATGAGSMASGGLSGIFGQGGVLSSLLSGATKVAGYGAQALGIPGGATAGGLFSAAGLTPAATSTGLAAAGKTGGGLMSFLGSETGAGLISGIGGGLMEKAKMDFQADESQKDRDYLRNKEERLTRSYDVPASSLPGGSPAPIAAAPANPAATAVTAVPGVPRPTPAQKFRYDYDGAAKRVVRVPV